MEIVLTYPAAIPLMRGAMIVLSQGGVAQPLRQIIPLADGAMFGVMPGASPDAFGAKLISVKPANFALGRPSHQGGVLLFDQANGAPVALVDAGALTAIRTAAASAAATDALARADARTLALLGYGEQALTHARAIAAIRPIEQIRIWGRRPDKAAALASRLEAELSVVATPAESAAAAVDGADIICTLTPAKEPILAGSAVTRGAHVNLVGAGHAGQREADDELVRRGRLFADHRESVLRQGGEVIHAIAAGLIDEAHVLGEIGQVFAGELPGRTSSSDITLYKSLGSIAQDLAAGWYLYGESVRRGLGVELDF